MDLSWVYIWFSTLFCLVHGYSAKELDAKSMKYLKTEQRWGKLGCVLLHNDNSSVITQFNMTMKQIRDELHLPINLYQYHHTIGNSVQCFHDSQLVPYTYSLDNQKRKGNLYKWFKKIFKQSSKYETKMLTTVDNSDQFKDITHKALLLVVFTGTHFFDHMVNIFNKIDVKKGDVFFVPPNTQIERKLIDSMNAGHFPTVIFLTRQSMYQRFEHYKTLEDEYNTNVDSIKLALLQYELRHIVAQKRSLQLLLDSRSQLSIPSCVTVYSSTSNTQQTYPFIHALHRTYNHLSDRHLVKFFLYDFSEPGHSSGLPELLRSPTINAVPFIFCNHLNRTIHGTSIAQTIFPTEKIPTPFIFERFIQQQLFRSPPPLSTSRLQIADPKVCFANSTNYCQPYDEEFDTSSLAEEETKDSGKFNGLRSRTKRLRIITDASWDRLINSRNQRDDLMRFDDSTSYRVQHSLVIFISAGCSYCQKIRPEFVKIAKSASYLKDVSVLSMNCTQHPIKCKQHHVTGFPTLLLFRTIQSERSSCIPNSMLLEPTWIDYHGEIKERTVMNWLSEVTDPSLTIHQDQPHTLKDKDIRLSIKFYTKRYVQTSLPRSLQSTLMHLSCLSILCERFHHVMDCVATPERGVMDYSPNDQNLYVSSISFLRSDKMSALIMKAGTPLANLFRLEGDLSRVSKAHRPHQYDIPWRLTCEDDHARCLTLLATFIQDHSRLPIFHINEAMFHSHQKTNNELWERPLLLVLGNETYFNTKSSFYKDLYVYAVEQYNSINVGLLDVTLHPHWARMFVPRNPTEDSLKLTSQYPRYVMLNMSDHSHAGFYPSLVEHTQMKSINSLADFVDGYLKDSSSMVVETEHF
ncbi:uncharacterized protein [Clytia hemisphaerica]|uniref:uncharacterized protein isoform X2 n=1 Tax=Clytia hemisphaerica TaxID=252671 RepID=UPI0034D5991B